MAQKLRVSTRKVVAAVGSAMTMRYAAADYDNWHQNGPQPQKRLLSDGLNSNFACIGLYF